MPLHTTPPLYAHGNEAASASTEMKTPGEAADRLLRKDVFPGRIVSRR